MKYYKLNKDSFIIPYNNNYIIYSPLETSIVKINKENLQISKSKSKLKENQDLKKRLSHFGIFNKHKQPIIKSNKYIPTNVTLMLTHQCNLKCIYCYSNGGERKDILDIEIAKKAVDFIVKNAIVTKTKEIGILFHGGGEPTMAWDNLVKIHDYTIKLAKNNNLKTKFSISTNGILNERKREWIAKNIDNIQLSFDGILQNEQRPSKNGNSTYDIVLKTAKKLEAYNKKYVIRITVHKNNLYLINDLFKDLFNKLDPTYVNIGIAVDRAGRNICSMKIIKKDYYLLKKQIKDIDKKNKINQNPLPINQLSSIHCGGCGTNFIVTPDGLVTTCLEVDSYDHRHGDIFIIGRYEKEKFIFYNEKIKYLRTRQVQNIKKCKNCFVKWNCAGDCLIDALDKGNFYSISGMRCNYIRDIGKERIINILNNQKL